MNRPLDRVIGQRHSTVLEMKQPDVRKTMIRALIVVAGGKKATPGH
jgi:hypothetical protein